MSARPIESVQLVEDTAVENAESLQPLRIPGDYGGEVQAPSNERKSLTEGGRWSASPASTMTLRTWQPIAD